ncbi:MAG TPA: phage portal protein [Bacteroidales bacterium]|nr:phage portal protein [Bacteroidales bacterium]
MLRQIANIAVYPDYNSGTYLKGYTGNVDVFTIINKITEPASIVPVYQYDKKDNEVEGRMIALLNNPNPFDSSLSRAELIEAALSFYLIFGDSYTAYDTIDNGPNANVPLRLDVLPPQWIEIVMGTYFNPIQGYKFMMSGNVLDYEKERVLHWKEFNPDYDQQGTGYLKGMSRLKPILKSVVGSSSAYDALVAAFQHSGAFGILSILDEEGATEGISKTQLSRIKQQYKDDYTGTKNTGKIVVTNKKHEWSNFGMTTRELQIIQALGAFKGAICDAYNVPDVLLSGSNDKTYMNFPEAARALWTNAIMPSLDAYLGKLSRWLAPKFKEEGHELRADYSGIEALQKNRKEQVEWMVKAGFTYNMIWKELGYDPSNEPYMDIPLVPAGMMPISEIGMMPGNTEEVMKRLKIPDYRNAN